MRVSLPLISVIAASFGVVNGAKIRSPSLEDQRRLKKEFMSAMHTKPKVAAGQKMGRDRRLQKLNEDLIKASRKMASSSSSSSSQQSSSGTYYSQQYQGGSSQGSSSYTRDYSDFLADQEGNLYFQANDGVYYNAYGQVVQPNDQGLYPWEYDLSYADLSSRAFKYAGCASIKSYDAERAGNSNNPLVVDTMAVFRLCPASSCNQYSVTGCGKNYAEYTLDVKSYLTHLLTYYDDSYTNYCNYCLPCDYDQKLVRKQFMTECYAQTDEDDWEYYQQLQQQAYKDFLNANGGSANNAAFHFYGQSPYNAGEGFDAYNGLYYNGATTGSGVNNPTNYYSQYDFQANYQNQAANTYQQQGYYKSKYYNHNGGRNRDLGNENYAFNEAYSYNAAYTDEALAQCQTFVQSMQELYTNVDQTDYYTSYQQKSQVRNYYDSNGNFNGYGGQSGSSANAMAQYNQQTYYDENSNFNTYAGGQSGTNNAAAMAEYWMSMDCCLDGSICDACQIEAQLEYGDCDSYICGDYYTFCESEYYGDNNQINTDITEFLECTAYEDKNGLQYYIGPHCGSDHYTISLGLFSDENCLDYIGDSVSVQSVLGYKFSDSDVFQFPDACIACDGAQSNDDDRSEYYTSPQATQEKTVIAMCSALHSVSAQCHNNMNNYQQVSRLMDATELAEEDRTCAFITNIMQGAYDENGVITSRAGTTFDFAEWKNPQQYGRLKLPADQAILLSFSIILCVSLAAVAYAQTKSLRKGNKEHSPWVPKRMFRRRFTLRSKDALLTKRRPSLSDQEPQPSAPDREDLDSISTNPSTVSAVSGILATRSENNPDDSSVYRPPSEGDSEIV